MNYLYEAPWWLPTAIAIAGIATFIAGNNRTNKGVRSLGAALVALAVVLMVASFLLDSEREVVVKRTRSLVEAVEKRDWTTFRGFLAPGITISLPDGSADDELTLPTTPDFLADSLKNFAEGQDLKTLRIGQLNTPLVEEDRIQASFQVFAESKGYNGLSGWMLQWDRDGGGQWVLTEIEPRDAPGFPASHAARELRSRVKRIPDAIRDLGR